MWEQFKQLGRHSIIYGIGIMATHAAGFLLIPIYTRVLTTADYGIYEIVNRFLEILTIFLGVGLRVTAVRFYQDGDDVRQKNTVISTAMYFMIPFGLVIVSIMFVIAPTWSEILFGTRAQTKVIQLALGLAFTELCYMVAAAYITARVRSLLFITVSGGKFLVVIALNIYLVYFLRRGVEGILTANLITSAVFSTVLIFATLKEIGLRFDFIKLKEMLRFGLPFVPGGIFLFILNSGDRFFLLHYGGESAVGLYALGYKFAMLVMLFVMSPFLRVWAALMVPVANKEDGPEIIARVFTYMMFLYLWVGLGLSVLSREIVATVAAAEFHSAYHIIPLVTLAYLFWSTALLGDTPFYVKKKTGIKPFILGAAAIVNLALYRILIPPYGVWGAAWATLISFAFFAALTRTLAQRTSHIPYENRRFFKMLAFALIMYGGSIYIPWPAPVIVWKAAYCLFFPIGLFTLGFIDQRERAKMRELWKQRAWRRAASPGVGE